ADRGRQHARDRCDRAIEAELAQHRETGERVRRDRADRRHQAERDRQIIVAAFLRHVGGREVDGDAPRRQRQARGGQRRAHALAGLGDGLVGQAHDVEGGQAGGDLNLDIDGAGLDALKRHCGDALNHAAPACARYYRKIYGGQEQSVNRIVLEGYARRRGPLAPTSAQHWEAGWMSVDFARPRGAFGVVALASVWLLGWPDGPAVPSSSAQEAKSSPQIWTVPEIGALPNNANGRLVRRGRD